MPIATLTEKGQIAIRDENRARRLGLIPAVMLAQ